MNKYPKQDKQKAEEDVQNLKRDLRQFSEWATAEIKNKDLQIRDLQNEKEKLKEERDTANLKLSEL